MNKNDKITDRNHGCILSLASYNMYLCKNNVVEIEDCSDDYKIIAKFTVADYTVLTEEYFDKLLTHILSIKDGI